MTSKSIDLTVKEVSYTKNDGFISSKLVLLLEGKSMNYVIANSIRRVSYDDIPTYAFECVNIEKNTSKAYDNDYMALRLRQLPIYNMKNDLFYLPNKYWYGVDYNNKNREKHESEKMIEAIINVVNDTNDKMSVTTQHLSYYIDNEKVPYYEPYPEEPTLLIELLPKQIFKCQLKACLGVGDRDTIWFASKDSYYEYDDETPNKVIFTIESAGQMSEYEILIKSCKYMAFKLEMIKKDIEGRVKSKEIKTAQTIFFELVNDDHTIGNLINDALQDHPEILYAGLSKPDHLIKTILFIMISKDKSPIGPLFDTLNYLESVFEHLEKIFTKMNKH